MTATPDPRWMTLAIRQSQLGIESGQGGPFGAVIVHQGHVIAQGHNQVLSNLDPTAHAEINVIRQACQQLQRFDLRGCDLYTSCEPCPMCLGAIYWARLDRVYYANTHRDAAAIGFDDQFIYEELARPHPQRRVPLIHHPQPEALQIFEQWATWDDRVNY